MSPSNPHLIFPPENGILQGMSKFAVEGDVLRAAGDLDTVDIAAFEAATNELLAATEGDVLLDFSGVEYMPSSFLSELMSLRSRLAGRGRKFVLRPSPVVRQLLQLTGMTASITVVD